LDNTILKIEASIKVAWFSIVGFFFVIQVIVIPLFQEYAVRYVHEMDRRAIEEIRKKGLLK